MMNLEDEFVELFNRLLAARGKGSRTELARYLNVDAAQITRLLGPEHEGKRAMTKRPVRLTVIRLQKLFEFFGISISKEILLANEKSYVNLAPLRGALAHGVWRENEMLPTASIREIPYTPDPDLSHLEHYSFQLLDGHANKKFLANTYVVCVDYSQARPEPIDNEVVVVERSYAISAKTKNVIARERSVRLLSIQNGRIRLLSLSDDPAVDDIEYDPSLGVRITDLVVGGYTPVK